MPIVITIKQVKEDKMKVHGKPIRIELHVERLRSTATLNCSYGK